MTEPVDDLDDPRVADYRDLKDTALRARRGLFVAESRLVVERLLLAGRYRLRSVLLTPEAYERLGKALAAAGPDLPVLVAAEGMIRRVVGYNFHRGCVALVERGAAPTVGDVLATCGSLLVVLEGMTNPDNVGGVFRNARAFGAGGVLLGPGCADPLYRKVIRVSMGASLELPFAHADDWPAVLGRLGAAGFTTVALAPRAALDVTALGRERPVGPRVALLLGAEGDGLSPAARAAADVEVRIPMAPGVDSLNAATAAGIALHRLGRHPGGG